MWEQELDPRIHPYVIWSSFYCIGHITLDWGLITSLVDIWHPKTHTFHLPIREMTITLQDVVVSKDFVFTSTCNLNWSLLCYKLLSVILPRYEIKRSTISTQ